MHVSCTPKCACKSLAKLLICYAQGAADLSQNFYTEYMGGGVGDKIGLVVIGRASLRPVDLGLYPAGSAKPGEYLSSDLTGSWWGWN